MTNISIFQQAPLLVVLLPIIRYKKDLVSSLAKDAFCAIKSLSPFTHKKKHKKTQKQTGFGREI